MSNCLGVEDCHFLNTAIKVPEIKGKKGVISSKRMIAESLSTSPDISWDLPPGSGKSNLNFRILAGLKKLRVQPKKKY